MHFICGLWPQLKRYISFEIARRKAARNGCEIGENSIILPALAKRANGNLTIGENSSIESADIDLRNAVRIGNNVVISNDSCIITTSHDVDSPEWEQKNYGLEIEDYVWVASHAMILPSCRKIGYGAVIGAGAVVVKDVPPMSIVSGNPAQVIRKRRCVHDKLVIPSLLSGDLKIYIETWKEGRK